MLLKFAQMLESPPRISVRTGAAKIALALVGILLCCSISGRGAYAASIKGCAEDGTYKSVAKLLKQGNSASRRGDNLAANQLLNRGIRKLEDYASSQRLSDYRDPNTVVLDDTGLPLSFAVEQERKGNLAVAAQLNASVLKSRLAIVCDDLNYQASHPGSSDQK